MTDEIDGGESQPLANLVPPNDQPGSLIGSMHGTMEILGDIVGPIDIEWEADDA